MTKRRQLICVIAILAFFGAILEPVPRTNQSNYSEETYKALESPFKGMPDEPLDLGSDQKFCRAFYNKTEKMTLQLSVLATDVGNRYTNVFQTDDLNMGLRLEINPEGKLSAVVQSPDGGPENFIGVMANGVVRANELSNVSVSVFSKTLGLSVDGGPTAFLEGDFTPTCKRVLIGGGYDSSRNTKGVVRARVQFEKVTYLTTFGLPMRVRDISRILFSLLIVAIVWEFRRKLFVISEESSD